MAEFFLDWYLKDIQILHLTYLYSCTLMRIMSAASSHVRERCAF
jgi:hypothetical protein